MARLTKRPHGDSPLDVLAPMLGCLILIAGFCGGLWWQI